MPSQQASRDLEDALHDAKMSVLKRIVDATGGERATATYVRELAEAFQALAGPPKSVR
jgi:plasmid stabilization system protein ParE